MHGRLGDSFSRVLLSFRGLVVDLGALVLGVVVLTFGLGLSYGPRAAFFAEAFTGTKNSDVAAYAAATRARPTRAARGELVSGVVLIGVLPDLQGPRSESNPLSVRRRALSRATRSQGSSLGAQGFWETVHARASAGLSCSG